MKDAKNFFSIKKEYTSKCEIKYYMLEANNCNSIKDNFISHVYDAFTGSMVITTNATNLPTGIDENSIVYKAFINKIEVLEDDISVSNGSLTISIDDVDSVYSDGTTAYGSSPYEIKIIASVENKSTGCIFDYIVPKISKNRFELNNVGDIYSIVYNPEFGETFDINNGTYRWRINGKVINNTGTSISLSNKDLMKYTDLEKAKCSVEIVGTDIILETDNFTIVRNSYLIQTVYEPIINNNDFYINFSTTHNALDSKVSYYIDNILQGSDALWNNAKGKELTTVITPVLANVPNVFDSNDLDSYTAYFRQKIETNIDFKINSNLLLNDVINNTVFNNTFTKRRFILKKNENTNYNNFVGKTFEPLNSIDSNPSINENIDGTWVNNKRTGLIYMETSANNDDKHFVLSDDLIGKQITHDDLVRKENIYINDEPTVFYRTVEDLSIDFIGDVNQLVNDANIGITAENNNSNIEIEFIAANDEKIIVIDFSTGFERSNAPVGSGLLVELYSKNNIKQSSYGLVKINANEYMIKEDNGLSSHKFQLTYNKNFHIRANNVTIKSMKIKFINSKEESIGIKNLVVTTRKV